MEPSNLSRGIRTSARRKTFVVVGAATVAVLSATCSSRAKSSATTGTSSTNTSGAQTTGAGGNMPSNVMPTHLPTATGKCPAMSNLNGTTATFAGQLATVWSGTPGGQGPLLLYYYATGSSPLEPAVTIGKAQIDKITAMGGAVVAQNKTTAMGTTTGNNVWYTGDAAIADEIVACAIENQQIDPRRIHVAGYSAGAIQTTYMWFARSGYVASILTYSGGDVGIDKTTSQDPMHPPAALVTHGALGMDTYGGIVDFFNASTLFEMDIKSANGFAIDCNDGGNHTNFALRTAVAPEALQFFLDHPYGVTPEPYATIPATFPAYCAIK